MKIDVDKSSKELNKIINEKNLEAYKEFVNYTLCAPVEQELALVDFECLCLDIKDPVEFLEFKMKKYLDIANKYNLDIKSLSDQFKNQISNKPI